MTHAQWKFWIDRGGTFTDIAARSPEGQIETLKLLSENPEQYPDAAVEGIRRLMRAEPGNALDGTKIDHVKMGTTVATNALLERKGDRTVLVTTKGFADALRIGYQNRPNLFAQNIVLPDLLHTHVIEAQERMQADGTVLIPLDEQALHSDLQAAFDRGYRSAAVVFMHGYRFAEHEKRVGEIAQAIGFEQISLSHDVSPLMKLVSRGDTTVVDAYLSPILRRYVDQVRSQVSETRLMFMQSNGGLTDATYFQGKDSILSGPAGGVVGMAQTAGQAGFEKVIGFDMGGTSTDVSHFDGEYERVFETQVAGVRLRAPMMHIHTVAAGGGSVLHFDGARLRVGPDSAGANPGPACYRRGGPLAVTDCNVMLGKIQPKHFPNVFGPKADQPLDGDIVREKFEALAAEVAQGTGKPMTPKLLAEGFLSIAVENMSNAIKKISVERGYDITQYALNCFGGAGGQHACLVADALGMDAIFIHPYAGILSAYGMGLADFTALREQAVEQTLSNDSLQDLRPTFETLIGDARQELIDQDIATENIVVRQKVLLRYAGTDTALEVVLDTVENVRSEFEEAHKRRFGFIQPDKDLIIEAVAVEAIGKDDHDALPSKVHVDSHDGPDVQETCAMTSGGQDYEVPLIRIEDFAPRDIVKGPAILTDANATTVVEPGWQAAYTDMGNLVLTRFEARPERQSIGTSADPIMLEIFNNLFMSIAEQMGATLANTAHSVNIKERLDFSCAIFDQGGNLVANAPHMPVHLGSMGESVKSVITAKGDELQPGDVYAINAPYNGGTHLPDVTVVTPVFEDGEVLFYVASRGHHADIGGISPGSMPPNSCTVEDEGVLLDNVKIVSQGRFLEKEVREILSLGHGPRAISIRISRISVHRSPPTKKALPSCCV